MSQKSISTQNISKQEKLLREYLSEHDIEDGQNIIGVIFDNEENCLIGHVIETDIIADVKELDWIVFNGICYQIDSIHEIDLETLLDTVFEIDSDFYSFLEKILEAKKRSIINVEDCITVYHTNGYCFSSQLDCEEYASEEEEEEADYPTENDYDQYDSYDIDYDNPIIPR